MSEEARQASGWRGPLTGLKVLDLTRVLAGPYATQNLADLGAEVFKVEPPQGDETRHFPPYVGGESHYYLAHNRGKKSLVIDARQPAGKDLVLRLAERVDVLVENFRPGVMDRLGFGYETLAARNPGLVYCSISGFGQTGPLRDMPSFDIVTQAMSGVISINGEADRAPVRLGLPLGDMVGGIYGPISILAALYERSITGRGRQIDISLHDGLVGMLTYFAQLSFVNGVDPRPVGSMHANIFPYGAFPCTDGQIVIAVLTESFWPRFCQALGLEEIADDPRFRTLADRRVHHVALNEIVFATTATKSVAEWEAILKRHDVPHAPILGIGAALSHPHTLARGMVVTTGHPTAGTIRMTGRPVKYTGAPQAPLEAPRLLGQDTADVLRSELGLGDDELRALADAGAISTGIAANGEET